MWKRLLPTLAALGAGFVVLCAGLVALNGIFTREREEGRRALADRRVALEQFAQQSIAETLRASLEQASPRLQRAESDPVADDGGLYLRRGREQVLPRHATPKDDPRTPGATLLSQLRARGARSVASAFDDDDPMRERLLLTDAVVEAVKSNARDAIETRFRALLSHRALYRVAAAKDVASTVYVLERFVQDGNPDPTLLRGLIRSGLPPMRGLQPALLEDPAAFGRTDFDALADAVVHLSERANVDYVDFAARVKAPAAVGPDLPNEVTSPLLLPDGWYVEPGDAGSVRGIAVEPPDVVALVEGAMAHRGLLEADDALRFDPPRFPIALTDWRVSLDSPRIAEQLRGLDSRFELKRGLLGACALFALIIVALAIVAQERKLRFVALRSDFVSTVSHELRTPLAAIRVMAETLDLRVGGTEAAGMYPSRIVAEADALGRLVENILVYNRLEKGRFDARRERVPLEDVFTRALDESRGYFLTTIRCETVPLRGHAVTGDPDLVRMVFSNLIHNACRYTQHDQVVLGLDARANAGCVMVRVTDDGLGIPRESWGTVFEEFRRLKTDGLPSRGGSGLGLAICRRIMRLHGGEIRIAASSPRGTTFELEFPVA